MSTSLLRRRLLHYLYGDEAPAIGTEIDSVLARHRGGTREATEPWSERDVWLITYADQFQEPGVAPLRTLDTFFARHLSPWLNGLHILPFYPWSSDDGFSVIDHRAVDAANGDWGDIERLAERFRLGVDAVLNHMSAQSSWFTRYLAGDPDYAGYFRTRCEGADYSTVVRPRALPLFTTFESVDGPVDVWTTFSADQVDLDFANPRVLLESIDILLTYARRGASFIRLDAIAFLWKQEGTPSMHLPETHAVIQLWRACLDDTYPDVLLLTETNVPHVENVSYFGDGAVVEAQMVYQFPLAPLVLDAFRTGHAGSLRDWAGSLELELPGTTFFNFLASHDGVGVRPLEGIAPSHAVDGLVDMTRRSGGEVSERTGPDGSAIPYELNSTWFDLLAEGVSEDDAVARHLGSHVIQLALQGIPGIYAHSLFGSRNDRELYARTGRARSLNRHKFTRIDRLEAALAGTGTTGRVYQGMRSLIERRSADAAFHPGSRQRVLDLPDGLFGVERIPPQGDATAVMVNVTADPITVNGRTIPPFGHVWGDRSR